MLSKGRVRNLLLLTGHLKQQHFTISKDTYLFAHDKVKNRYIRIPLVVWMSDEIY